MPPPLPAEGDGRVNATELGRSIEDWLEPPAGNLGISIPPFNRSWGSNRGKRQLGSFAHTPAGGGYPVNELSLLVMIFLPSMMCLIGSWVAELMLEMLAPARKASATLTPATTG